MVGRNPIVLVGTKMDLLPDGTHPRVRSAVPYACAVRAATWHCRMYARVSPPRAPTSRPEKHRSVAFLHHTPAGRGRVASGGGAAQGAQRRLVPPRLQPHGRRCGARRVRACVRVALCVRPWWTGGGGAAIKATRAKVHGVCVRACVLRFASDGTALVERLLEPCHRRRCGQAPPVRHGASSVAPWWTLSAALGAVSARQRCAPFQLWAAARSARSPHAGLVLAEAQAGGGR